MGVISSVMGWFGRGSALAESAGRVASIPSVPLVNDSAIIGVDGALQIATVWLCLERRANLISSLPLFTYNVAADGQKKLARGTRLYELLHTSPNDRMTAAEFWQTMILSRDLRGNAYARLQRDARTGEVLSMWPMPTDQVQPIVLADGSIVYEYRVASDVAIIAAQNVLHIKGMGNGTLGLSKIDFMRATTDEAAKAQAVATRSFANGGKPSGILMVDHVLKADQRLAVRERFSEMATGTMARLFLLEANMKYEPLSLTPEQQQLLETRHFGIEEICRWFDVPPVLVHHANVTTWGTGVEQIISGFYKLAIAPVLVNIEQAIAKRVLTPAQRATMKVEFSFDGLLRGDVAARGQYYAQALQNGWLTRNEVRQLENSPRSDGPGADALTAQVNLVPLDKLGQQSPRPAASVGSV